MRVVFSICAYLLFTCHGIIEESGHAKSASLGALGNLLLMVNPRASHASAWLWPGNSLAIYGRPMNHARLAASMSGSGDLNEEARIRQSLEGPKASDRHAQVASGTRKHRSHMEQASELTVKDAQKASFEDAQVIGRRLAEVLSESCQAGEPMPDEAVNLLRSLVSTTSGARGWFVSLLTEPDYEPIFRPPIDDSILRAIADNPAPNVKLMTMNIAMPTATELAHLQNGNVELAAASRMTRDRAKALVSALLTDYAEGLPGLKESLVALLSAVQPDAEVDGSGADADWLKFCRKWGYNKEQRDAIRREVASLVES